MPRPVRKVVGDMTFTTTISTALCRQCDVLVEAEMVDTNLGGYRVADRWTCPEGHVIYDWHYDAGRPKFVPEPPRPPRGQMGLF